MFLPKGELIDEDGTVYQGTQEIGDLLNAFFQQFPGTKLALNIESIRQAGPVAIEDGTRTMTTASGGVKSQFRYIAVWAKSDRGWRLASFRDFADDPTPTANEFLQPLAWLVGDWINEGVDGKVAISYRWSDDKNFLLGEYKMTSPEVRCATRRSGSAGILPSARFAPGCSTPTAASRKPIGRLPTTGSSSNRHP